MTEHDRLIWPKTPLVQNALSILADTSRVVGEEYFPVLVEGLAEALGMRWALIARFDTDNPVEAGTIAFWDNGPAKNFIYKLEDTPCSDVAKLGVCTFPSAIQKAYPKDQLLVDMGAQSYAGTALRASDGRVLGLIAVLDDKNLDDPKAVEEIVSLFAGRAAAELERLMTASISERLGKIIEASVGEAYVFSSKDFRFELVNRGARQNLGYSMQEMLDLTPWDLKPEYEREDFLAFVQPLLDGSEEMLVFETVHQRKDGSTYPVCVHLQYFPDAGKVFFASITDETEHARQKEHERVILKEMNHRAKNVLAVVQVIAKQTARRNPEDYIDRLEARISALSASHDVLVDHDWKDLTFEELLISQLGHFKHLIGRRIELVGPNVLLQASAAQGFGMVLHELATNAAKYGALSTPEGKVTICWRVVEEEKNKPAFEIVWRESGGPLVSEPKTRSFGSFLIEKSLSSQFGCVVSSDYRPTGLVCTFQASAGAVLKDDCS